MYVSENRTKGNGRGTHKGTENGFGSGNVDKTWKEPIHVRRLVSIRYSTCSCTEQTWENGYISYGMGIYT